MLDDGEHTRNGLYKAEKVPSFPPFPRKPFVFNDLRLRNPEETREFCLTKKVFALTGEVLRRRKGVTAKRARGHLRISPRTLAETSISCWFGKRKGVYGCHATEFDFGCY